MMTLDRRPCLLGSNHGDISMTGIMLEREELNRLLEDEGAWNCWFTARVGKLPEPAPWTKHLRRFAHAEKFDAARVVLHVRARTESITLTGLRIFNLKLTPQMGGLTELSLTCTPAHGAPIAEWDDELADVQLEIDKSGRTRTLAVAEQPAQLLPHVHHALVDVRDQAEDSEQTGDVHAEERPKLPSLHGNPLALTALSQGLQLALQGDQALIEPSYVVVQAPRDHEGPGQAKPCVPGHELSIGAAP